MILEKWENTTKIPYIFHLDSPDTDLWPYFYFIIFFELFENKF